MLITPEHQQLQEKYQQLLAKSMEFESVVAKKDEQIKILQSEIVPLKKFSEEMLEKYRVLHAADEHQSY